MANRGRSKTPVVCAVCPTVFFPWHRKRVLPPTCSIKCARALTGQAQRGRPMTAALRGLAVKRENEAEAVGRRFGSKLTPREVAIYRYGISVGTDREYLRWRSRRTVAA